jgi:hypothetical protein
MLMVSALVWVVVIGLRTDLRQGIVLNVTGQAVLYVNPRPTRHYVMKINGMDFDLPNLAHQAILSGSPYQVFYVPASKLIVSAVRVDESPDLEDSDL